MWKRLYALLRHGDLDRGLNAEVRFHVEMETEKNIKLGMSPEDARLRALRSFGPMEKHKEDTRDARGVSWLETLVADLRYGARALLKHPGYALLAVLTLGLGIGANTAIFSVINGVLLKPLPYEHGDRLVIVQQSRPLSGQPQVGVAIAEYFDYRERGKDVFDGLVEYHQMNFDLINRGEPDRVDTGVVSANFFDLLGIKPILGRTFVASDDVRDAEAVLILSHTYWRTKFGGDPNIVGQVFEMNDRPHRVIGVLPNVPHYPQENDVYMPVLACPFRAAGERQIAQNRRAFGGLNVFGRLKEGATPEQAASTVGAICHNFTQDNAYKQVYRPETSGFRATTIPVREALTTGARQLLLLLLGITGLVLLIACANVANLTLARMLGRDRELAMRAALGAGRGRLVRQLLTESTLLAVVGGAIGIGVAWLTIDMLTTFVGRFTSRTGEITLDPIVLIFTLGISIFTGLLFGTLPALGSRVDLVSALKQGGGQAGDAGTRKKMQGALIVAQVAVSVMLLVGAGLLLASFYRLQRVETGYRSDGVLSAQIFGNFSRYPNINAQRKLYLPVLERLQALPGVNAAAITNAVPLGGGAPGTTRFEIEGRAVDDPERRPTTDVRVATPQYFATIGVPVMSGRVFNDLDNEESMRVVVINKAMTQVLGRRRSDRIADQGDWPTQCAALGLVYRGRRRRRRQTVWAGPGHGRAAVSAVDANAVRHCRAGPGEDRGRSGSLRQRVAKRGARDRSEPAGRERADPGRPAIGSAGGAEAHRDTARRVRRVGVARHAGRYRRGDRDLRAAAHEGIWPAHGARGAARQRLGDGRAPGIDARGDRTGDRRRRSPRRRPRAVVVSLPDRPKRSDHLRGRRAGVRARRHDCVPDSGASRDDGRSADRPQG